jgi:hypothetical protein
MLASKKHSIQSPDEKSRKTASSENEFFLRVIERADEGVDFSVRLDWGSN